MNSKNRDRERVMVSAIIPTYNRSEAVIRSIDSVLNQTYTNIEIIIIDDGSKDDTRKRIENLYSDEVIYERNEMNRGVSYARNVGIKISSGRYVAFLDSDDVWLPRKIERQIEEISKDDYSLCYTGEAIFDGRHISERENMLMKRCPERGGDVFCELVYRDFIGSCSRVMVDKESLLEVGGFDEKLEAREDWDMWLRISKNNRVCNVKDVLVERYIGGDGLSRDEERVNNSTKKVLDKHSEIITKNRKLFSHHLYLTAKREMLNDRLEGWAMSAASLILNPFQPKLLLIMIVSLFGCDNYSYILKKWAEMRGHYSVSRA